MANALPTTPVPAAHELSAFESRIRVAGENVARLENIAALIVTPFPHSAALDYLHGAYVLSESDESAIVEAAAIRYGKLPAVEQDGSFEWLVDCEFDKLNAERREGYEDSYAEHCGAFNRPRAW